MCQKQENSAQNTQPVIDLLAVYACFYIEVYFRGKHSVFLQFFILTDKAPYIPDKAQGRLKSIAPHIFARIRF